MLEWWREAQDVQDVQSLPLILSVMGGHQRLFSRGQT